MTAKKNAKQKKERTRLVQTRIPEDAAAKLETIADEAGMSVAGYLKHLILTDLEWKISLASRVSILEVQVTDLTARVADLERTRDL